MTLFYNIKKSEANLLSIRGQVSQTADLVKSLKINEYFVVPKDHINFYKNGSNSLYSKVNKLRNRTLKDRSFKVYEGLEGYVVKRVN